MNHSKFRLFFAVHEFEAWLLSQPDIFPSVIRDVLPKNIAQPEQVNFNEPPAKLLNRVYNQKTGHDYKKLVDGTQLFAKLDPNTAAGKCPHLRALLEEMLALAEDAGLTKKENDVDP